MISTLYEGCINYNTECRCIGWVTRILDEYSVDMSTLCVGWEECLKYEYNVHYDEDLIGYWSVCDMTKVHAWWVLCGGISEVYIQLTYSLYDYNMCEDVCWHKYSLHKMRVIQLCVQWMLNIYTIVTQ